MNAFAVAALVGLVTANAPPAPSPPEAPVLSVESRQAALTRACQECHADMDPDERLKFPDGTSRPLLVDDARWKASVHGKNIGCADCHTTIVGDPHPPHSAPGAREYQVQQSRTCRGCHYAHHTRLVDSVHFQELGKGNLEAPTCVDCHDPHGLPADTPNPRLAIEQRCARCHETIAGQYRSSAHGAAIRGGEGAADLPVCTDCHGVHRIPDPRPQSFHVRSFEVCGRCHSDRERMTRHGLNPDVLSTYLDDFHGVSSRLYAQGAGTPDKPMATCIDCHGVHDVQRLGGDDKAAVKQRVAAVCRRCHERVPDEFADAWLSHYPPTRASAPLVWGITWIYRILIPLILVGLVLHILLDLWRIRVRRMGGVS